MLNAKDLTYFLQVYFKVKYDPNFALIQRFYGFLFFKNFLK